MAVRLHFAREYQQVLLFLSSTNRLARTCTASEAGTTSISPKSTSSFWLAMSRMAKTSYRVRRCMRWSWSMTRRVGPCQYLQKTEYKLVYLPDCNLHTARIDRNPSTIPFPL
ncbi:hypothetical protein BDW66DRAFT_112567 [Aspergillus desertorum]